MMLFHLPFRFLHLALSWFGAIFTTAAAAAAAADDDDDDVHMSLDFKFDPTTAEKWRDLRS
jgi:hypothetical protein